MPRRHFYEFEAIMKQMEEETNDTGRNVIHINTIQRLLRDTPTVEAVQLEEIQNLKNPFSPFTLPDAYSGFEAAKFQLIRKYGKKVQE